MTNSLKARLIAFYLPQYYPTAENDQWWGKGFTEWTNVTQARPVFPGHQQPNLPSDLGFYDLRVPETRQAQADMARDYGIEGFCYWHYWLGDGRRILDRVFNEVLESGNPNFPFCLAWANESWNRSWRGQASQVLIEQTYPGETDHREHFRFLLKAFRDPRYIRVDDKPLFVIYNPHLLPDAKKVIHLWRTMASEAGLPGLFVPGICEDGLPLDLYGLDARIPPQPWSFMQLNASGRANRVRPPFVVRVTNKLWGYIRSKIGLPNIYSYRSKANLYCRLPTCDSKTIPCVLPNWDYTPRSRRSARSVVFPDATPEQYRRVLHKAIADVSGRPTSQRLVFLKSWNEWAEGNHLEPGKRFGHDFLKVTKEEAMSPDEDQV